MLCTTHGVACSDDGILWVGILYLGHEEIFGCAQVQIFIIEGQVFGGGLVKVTA
jgi:hypothetical protein